MREPVYFIQDPDLIVQLTVRDFDYFENHGSFVDDTTDSMWGNAMLMLKGSKWRAMRSCMSPIFTCSKIRSFSKLFVEVASNTCDHIIEEAKVKRASYNIKDVFYNYSTCLIASCCFGVETNILKHKYDEFIQIAKRAGDFGSPKAMLKLFIIKIAPWFLKIFGIEFTEAHVKQYIKSVILGNIKFREENKIYRADIVNELVKIRNPSATSRLTKRTEMPSRNIAIQSESRKYNLEWTDDELVAQCYAFFVAGSEIVSTVLCSIAYELALNQDIQQKLFEEILCTHRALNGDQPNYETLKSMKYMNQIVSEAFRLRPPIPFTNRMCVKDYNTMDVDGRIPISVKKGATIWIPIYTMHHDAKNFPNPDKFDPERFNEKNAKNIKTGSYIPFGIGPRACLGKLYF